MDFVDAINDKKVFAKLLQGVFKGKAKRKIWYCGTPKENSKTSIR